MKIHHLGYAVASIEKALPSFEALGFQSEGDVVDDEGRDIRILFVKNGPLRMELVAPLRSGSPVDAVLKRNGAMPYHVCYEVADMNGAVDALVKSGYKVVCKAAPAPAINGRNVVFLFSLQAGLVELLENVEGDL